jgi:hypothetical protein
MKKWHFLILTLTVGQLSAQALQEEWITIFVHGLVALKSNLSPALVRPLLFDEIEGTCYERNVVAVRDNPFLFTVQAMQGLGLRRINRHVASPSGAYAFALLFDQVYKYCYGETTKNSYYTFGWTGLLSYKRRYQEARILYNQIKEELMRLKARGHTPKVRILAYSHGGNLVLNLPAIRANECPDDTFCIDELIVLGVPVSNRSEQLIQFPLFKTMYHLYSKSDLVQRLDITVPSGIPHRIFKGCVPDTLTQIEVRLRAPMRRKSHTCSPSFMRGIINQSPGHFEFWFFGWASHIYRQNWVLYPLPLGVLAPCIIRAAQALTQCPRHVIVDIRPDQGIAFVKDPACTATVTTPFLSVDKLTALQWKAVSFHPGQPEYINEYLRLQSTVSPDTYK